MKGNKTERVFSKPKQVKDEHLIIQAESLKIRKEKQEYQQLCKEARQNIKIKQLSKHTKIRLLAWLESLDRMQFNNAWRKNRNIYLKLLNLMIDCQYICFPFLTFPSKEPLQILQKHQINQIINEIQKAVKLNRIQSRKPSQFMKKESTRVNIHQQSSSHLEEKSHRKVSSVSNDSIRTLSVSQDMMNKLWKKRNSTKIDKQNQTIKKQQQYFKNSLFVPNSSFQTQKFAENQTFSNNNLKNYKNSSKYNSPLRQAILNSEAKSVLVSQQLKNMADSFQTRFKGQTTNYLWIPNKAGKKKVVFKTSPNFNKMAKNWSEKYDKTQKQMMAKRYWQSSSLAQVGTPRYLNLYPSNPYASLALSDQHEQRYDNIDTTRSKENCCSNCLSKLWSVS